MTKHTAVFALVAFVCAVPFVFAHALTDDEIRAQINVLIGRIQKLQEDMKTLTVPTTTPDVVKPTSAASSTPSQSTAKVCARITKALSFGSRGNEVLELQKFLVGSGDLQADSATGYFGALTRVAVRVYQAREGIVSDGDEATTGWGMIGARTRARIACGGTSALGANLSVTQSNMSVTLRATVNTRKSCAASVYILSYGDNTATETMNVSQNVCSPREYEFTHTYTAAGRYTISITSGTLMVSLPVTIVPPAASCVPPSFFVTSVPSARVGNVYTLPLMSYQEAQLSTTTLFANGLPSGLLLSSTTTAEIHGTTTRAWAISGTALDATTSSVSIMASNPCGSSRLIITLPVIQ